MEAAFFEQMAMPLFDQLYNFAHWLAGNPADAEDLVQETFAKALKGFHSFEAGTNMRAWMFSILRNTFLTSKSGLAARKSFSLEEGDAENIASREETPEVLLLRQEGQGRLMEALTALPVLYREAILLCDVEEMSYKEIAEVLSVPVGTVMSRLFRARAALRKQLGGHVRKGTIHVV